MSLRLSTPYAFYNYDPLSMGDFALFRVLIQLQNSKECYNKRINISCFVGVLVEDIWNKGLILL